MSNENDTDNIFNTLFSGFGTPGYSEADIISMYVNGTITKEEYLKMMDARRGK